MLMSTKTKLKKIDKKTKSKLNEKTNKLKH